MKKVFSVLAAVLVTALVLIGCPNGTETVQEAVSHDETADVVVVGAGLAGLSAAIELQESYPELKFVLLEQRDITGGSSNSSGGTMATSSQEKTNFVTNNLDGLRKFYQHFFTEKGVNVTLFDKLYGKISEDYFIRLLDWDVTFRKATVYSEFTDFDPNIHYYYPVFNGGPSAGGTEGGRALSAFLTSKIQDKGSDLRLESRVSDLIIVNGKVVGVKVDDAEKSYNIYAKAVILTTGRFGMNRAMVKEYTGDYYKYVPIVSYSVHVGAQGDAFTFTKKLNVPHIGDGTFAFTMAQGSALPSKFFVNQDGSRFTNEGSGWGYKVINDAARQGTYTYRIIDVKDLNETQRAAQNTRVDNGQAWSFTSLSGTSTSLAETLGIDPVNLAATIATYNGYADTILDPSGKTDGFPVADATTIENGPYYADLICGSSFGTIRSLKIDGDGRVINASYPIADTDVSSATERVPELYAAGECIIANVFPSGYYHGGLGMSIAAYTATMTVRTVASDLTAPTE